MSTNNTTSHMNHHHRRHRHLYNNWNQDSDELDVFEATRYFSGSTDSDLGGGARGSTDPHGVLEAGERPPRRGQKHASLDKRSIISASQMKEMKKSKQPSSPGAKLVSYLNSFFYQAASRRKLKCLNPDSAARDAPEDVEEAAERSHGERERSRRSVGSSKTSGAAASKSSNFCGSSSFTTPHFHPNSSLRKEKDHRLHGIRFQERERETENKWVLNKPGDDQYQMMKRYWFQEHELPLTSRSTRNKNSEDEEEEEEEDDDGDGESVSSSDLFELKIYGQNNNGSFSSGGLPVFATTDIEAFKRETAISSTAAKLSV
ncbi:protein BIG GRAIN 1-like E [Canna indica]|uniref:Protein BIG GRAIN 1-like E n=1 Tax=Canna indica TaxID=4628 RepID=A0AAQ3QBK2_9LILI|nr:protein BIG GRAIN 1-like E [Canna indica]